MVRYVKVVHARTRALAVQCCVELVRCTMFVGMSRQGERSRNRVWFLFVGTSWQGRAIYEPGVVLGQSSLPFPEHGEFSFRIVGKHVRILKVSFSQTHVAHGRSNAVLLNFNAAPCSSVRLGTAERSRNPDAVLEQSSSPFSELEGSFPALCMQAETESALVGINDKRHLGLLRKPVCLH